MKKISYVFLFLFLGIVFTACSANTTEDVRLQVAVSITPQAAFVDNVGKEYVNVMTVIPPGYSPANYEPSAKAMASLSEVDVYFTIGVPTEAGNILPEVETLNTVHLAEKVREVYSDLEFSPGSRDPHIWLSIKRVKVMVQAIADELARLDPEMRDYYLDNASDYLSELDTLDQEIFEFYNNKTMRKFIVFHPAYRYFADEYNLEMYALEQDGKEATVSHLQAMIDLARDNEIHVIFYQSEVDSSQVESFAEEIDGEGVSLNPLAYDYIANLRNLAEEIRDSLS